MDFLNQFRARALAQAQAKTTSQLQDETLCLEPNPKDPNKLCSHKIGHQLEPKFSLRHKAKHKYKVGQFSPAAPSPPL
jgi:hypothetical protein